MTKYSTNAAVDFYFTKDTKWLREYKELRKIVADCGLTEELKWGCPCYTFKGKNIVLIHGFKDYCALLFMKGALLHNTDGLLIQQTKNVQAARQIRFTNLKEIVKLAPTLKAYIYEAIEVERAGLSISLKETAAFEMVEEFQTKLDELPALQKAFEALTPGRQRAYMLHFSAAKQAKTRESRIEKWIPSILKGKGLNDL
jgi:uncharacterized protein YdeI (YjbR/CyaY-like superfamily)